MAEATGSRPDSNVNTTLVPQNDQPANDQPANDQPAKDQTAKDQAAEDPCIDVSIEWAGSGVEICQQKIIRQVFVNQNADQVLQLLVWEAIKSVDLQEWKRIENSANIRLFLDHDGIEITLSPFIAPTAKASRVDLAVFSKLKSTSIDAPIATVARAKHCVLAVAVYSPSIALYGLTPAFHNRRLTLSFENSNISNKLGSVCAVYRCAMAKVRFDMNMSCKQLVDAAGGRLVLQFFEGKISKELAKEAVKADAFALEFARQFADDIDVVTAAVERCCYAYRFASDNIKSNVNLAHLVLNLAKQHYADACQLRYVHDLSFSDGRLVNADCASRINHPWNYISKSLQMKMPIALLDESISRSEAVFKARSL